MSCRWGRRGEGAVFVWGRHGGEQRAPGRCYGTWSRSGARYREAWLRGWLMRGRGCGPVRAARQRGPRPQTGAMSRAGAEARRAALLLPRSEWPWLVRGALFCVLACLLRGRALFKAR